MDDAARRVTIPPENQSEEQPGQSSARNAQESDPKITLLKQRSVLNAEDDEQQFESSDSDDEQMFLAKQLSMIDELEDFRSDSDDEQMLLAKQLSLMMMDSDNSPTKNEDVENDNDENVNEIHDQPVCEICTDTSDDMLSYGCPHSYCRNCVQTCLETDIIDGKIESFKCPALECDVRVTENFVKMVVSAAIFNKYETLMIKKVVGDMDDIIYCPIVDCGAMIETELSNMTQCWKCSHLLCTLCSKLYHGNTDCELTEDERTDNLRRIRDEEIAENILLEESQDQLVMEEIERENEEWSRRVREEQAEIRRIEQIEQEEEERRQEEARRRIEEIRKLEEERRKAEQFQRLVIENEERERQQQEKLDMRRQAEQASEDTVKETTKPCPNCKSPIEKNEGCIHMTCIKCRFEFCWGCMTVWVHHHTCPPNYRWLQ